MILAKSTGKTLKEHTKSVMKVARIIAKKLGLDDEMAKLLEIAAHYHDSGKVNPAFQKRVKNPEFSDAEPGFENIPHSFLSVAFVPRQLLEEIGEENSAILLSSIAFHHWRDSFLSYMFGERSDEVKKAFKWIVSNEKELRELLEKEGISAQVNLPLAEYLTKASLFDSSMILPPHVLYTLPSFLMKESKLSDDAYKKYVILKGSLMRADRFASMADEDPNISHHEVIVEYPKDHREKVKTHMEKMGYDIWQERYLKDKNTVLVAPTGAGKTEYALLWSRGRLILTLPLRSAVNMLFERLKDHFGENYVSLLHSDADLVLFESLTGKAANPTELEGELEKIMSLSRFLSYPFIVSTGDQIFLAAYKYPGYELMYSVLSGGDLVVDEVQAYEPYAAAAVVKLLEDVESLGGRFLLMTATLPKFIKDEIERRTDAEFVDVYGEVAGKRHVVEIRFNKSAQVGTMEDLALEKFKEGKRVLLVRNTVKDAISSFERLKAQVGKDEIFLLHSRMTYDDRAEKEERLEKFKPGSLQGAAILVATQVVEASLNIDFDVLITDICPADSLVQRMGRVYRKREYKSDEPNVYVFVFSDKNSLRYYKGVYHRSSIILTLAHMLFGEITLEGKKAVNNAEEKVKKALKEPEILIFDSQAKKELVEDVYESLAAVNDSYYKSFVEALRILDSGYIAESRNDAQRIFRKIATVDVVPENFVPDLEKELKDAKTPVEIKLALRKYTVPVSAYSLKNLGPELYEPESEYARRRMGKLLVVKGVYERGVGLKTS